MPTRAEITFLQMWTECAVGEVLTCADASAWAVEKRDACESRSERAHFIAVPGATSEPPLIMHSVLMHSVRIWRNSTVPRSGSVVHRSRSANAHSKPLWLLTPAGSDLVATARGAGIPERADDESEPSAEVEPTLVVCPTCKGAKRVKLPGLMGLMAADPLSEVDWDATCETCEGRGEVPGGVAPPVAEFSNYRIEIEGLNATPEGQARSVLFQDLGRAVMGSVSQGRLGPSAASAGLRHPTTGSRPPLPYVSTRDSENPTVPYVEAVREVPSAERANAGVEPEHPVDCPPHFVHIGGAVRATFGKHSGKKLEDVPSAYLHWVTGAGFPAAAIDFVSSYLQTRCAQAAALARDGILTRDEAGAAMSPSADEPEWVTDPDAMRTLLREASVSGREVDCRWAGGASLKLESIGGKVVAWDAGDEKTPVYMEAARCGEVGTLWCGVGGVTAGVNDGLTIVGARYRS